MTEPLVRLCLEVLKDNVMSQEFNELLVETGISLESPEWEVTNQMLIKAEDILWTLGENKNSIH